MKDQLKKLFDGLDRKIIINLIVGGIALGNSITNFALNQVWAAIPWVITFLWTILSYLDQRLLRLYKTLTDKQKELIDNLLKLRNKEHLNRMGIRDN